MSTKVEQAPSWLTESANRLKLIGIMHDAFDPKVSDAEIRARIKEYAIIMGPPSQAVPLNRKARRALAKGKATPTV